MSLWQKLTYFLDPQQQSRLSCSTPGGGIVADMSRFTVTVHAYDSYDRVRCVVRVHDFALPGGSSRLVVAIDRDFAGTGESDPQLWLIDVLAVLKHAVDHQPWSSLDT